MFGGTPAHVSDLFGNGRGGFAPGEVGVQPRGGQLVGLGRRAAKEQRRVGRLHGG